MIIVDTSVWVDHLRAKNTVLLKLIAEGVMLHHPFVTAELALGSLVDRDQFCEMLQGFPQIEPISTDDLVTFAVEHDLHGTGLGMVDAHLLAAAKSHDRATVWTTDKRLLAQAERLSIAYEY
jgi:predicted nucleic acid-binding protein